MWRLARGAIALSRQVGRSWNDAYAALGSGRYAVVSIDCFDTLIARLAPDWEQISIARIGATLAGHSPAGAEKRIKSVRASLRARGVCEPTALAIWQEFCVQSRLSPTLADKFETYEFELLKASSAASGYACTFVAQASRQAVPLIVCSDTRLPARSLGRLLGHHGLNIAEQAIVCSCDYNLSKFRGSLYPAAAERIGSLTGTCISPREVLHVGDNPFSDFYSSACHGWNCVKVPAASLAPDQRSIAGQAELRLQAIEDSLAATRQ